MELDMLKTCWQEEGRTARYERLDTVSVGESIRAASVEVRRGVRHRVQREIGYYVPSLVALLLFVDFRTRAGLVFVASLAILLGGTMAVLWAIEHRLAGSGRDGSLRQVVAALLTEVEAASRAYFATFVGMVACSALLIVAAVWWRRGAHPHVAVAAGAGTLLIAWAVWSGRRYVNRMFGPYRDTLAGCLRELNEAR